VCLWVEVIDDGQREEGRRHNKKDCDQVAFKETEVSPNELSAT
jgi:hypothetical protein